MSVVSNKEIGSYVATTGIIYIQKLVQLPIVQTVQPSNLCKYHSPQIQQVLFPTKWRTHENLNPSSLTTKGKRASESCLCNPVLSHPSRHNRLVTYSTYLTHSPFLSPPYLICQCLHSTLLILFQSSLASMCCPALSAPPCTHSTRLYPQKRICNYRRVRAW